MIESLFNNIYQKLSSLNLLPKNSQQSSDIENQILINFGTGNLKSGFSEVTIQLLNLDFSLKEQQTVSLKNEPDIELIVQKWHTLYLSIYGAFDLRSGIKLDLNLPTNVSDVGLEELGEQLKISLDNWLMPLELKISYLLQKVERARIVISTNNEQLQRLPWHLWQLFEESDNCVEYALSSTNYRKPQKSRTPEGIVRILAVFGNSEGIDLNSDRQILSNLSNADICILEQPDRTTLDSSIRDSKGWDIIFFAGHSNTVEGKGVLQINDRDILDIQELRSCLKAATDNGTQLAIFNSCDGLGLANTLGEVDLSHIIVMGESIPDRVAQEFVNYWLSEFAQGKSFYATTRGARERLKILEKDYPCASWLPVIFQNPTEEAPTWRKLRNIKRVSWKVPVIAGLAIAGIVTGIRHTGALKNFELTTYDTFLSWRKDEGTDPRILLITGRDENPDSPDYQFGNEVIADTIEAIEPFKPRVIGLDLTRNIKAMKSDNRLKTVFLNNETISSACDQEQKKTNQQETFGPERMGFVSIPENSDESNIVRRVTLFRNPISDPCQAHTYLGTKLALDYLAQDEKILEKFDKKIYQELNDKKVKIGKQTYRPLPKYMGVYQKTNNFGYENLLNYRISEKPFEVVTIADILGNKVDRELIHDRIVIIGLDLENVDRHNLPFESNVAGIQVVAHVTSQILDNALGEKPAIWALPFSIEVISILAISITGGVLSCYGNNRQILFLVLGTSLLIIPGLSWFVLQSYGLWISVVPIEIGFIGSYILAFSFAKKISL